MPEELATVSNTSRRTLLVPIVAVLVLAVISAGCMVQDRPHEAEFFVVADAGPDQVLEAGSTAHFEWSEDHAIEAEGNATPDVELAYAWAVSQSPGSTGSGTNFSYSSSAPDFALVTLHVTGEKATAADAAGVLFVPGEADASRKIYLAVRGDLRIGGSPQHVVSDYSEGSFPAQALAAPLDLPAGPYAPVPLGVEFSLAGSPEGSILVGVKDGAGAARTAASQMLEFDSGSQYTLLVDTTPAAVHRMVIHQGATETGNVTLDDFKAAHAVADHEEKVLVSHAQTLPGFEGAVVAVTIGIAALLAARRRRP